MTPDRAIEVADEKGFCKLGRKAYLMKTSEARKVIQFVDPGKPYIIIFDRPDWSDVHGLTNAKDARLIQACGVRS